MGIVQRVRSGGFKGTHRATGGGRSVKIRKRDEESEEMQASSLKSASAAPTKPVPGKMNKPVSVPTPVAGGPKPVKPKPAFKSPIIRRRPVGPKPPVSNRGGFEVTEGQIKDPGPNGNKPKPGTVRRPTNTRDPVRRGNSIKKFDPDDEMMQRRREAIKRRLQKKG